MQTLYNKLFFRIKVDKVSYRKMTGTLIFLECKLCRKKFGFNVIIKSFIIKKWFYF